MEEPLLDPDDRRGSVSFASRVDSKLSSDSGVSDESPDNQTRKMSLYKAARKSIKQKMEKDSKREIKLQTAYVAFKNLEDYALLLAQNKHRLEEADELLADLMDALTRKHSARDHHLRQSVKEIKHAIVDSDATRLHLAIEEARYILGEPHELSALTELRFQVQRMKFFFFFIVTSLMVVSFSIGPQVQFFVVAVADVHETETTNKVQQAAVFFLQPFFLCFLALIGDELFDLTLDACDSPSLVLCRSMMLAAMTEYGKYPSEFHCRFLSLWFGVLYEVVPLAFALRNLNLKSGQCGADFWEGYLIGGMLMTGITTVLFLVADLRVNWDGGQDGWDSRDSTFKRIRSAINEIGVDPSSMTKDGVLETMHVHMREDLSIQANANAVCKMTPKEIEEKKACFRFGVGLLLVSTMVWGVVTVLLMVGKESAGVHHLMAIAGCVMVLVVIILSVALTKLCPGLIGAAHWLVLSIFVLVTVALLLSYKVQIVQQNIGPLMTQPLNSSAVGVDMLPADTSDSTADMSTVGVDVLPPTWHGDRTSQYSVCRMKWFDDLGVLDLAALANAIYEPSEAGVRSIVSESFAGTDLKPEVKHVTTYTAFPRWMSVQFHREGSNRKTWVIAVKGSSTTRDFYMDTELFATIKVLQIFSAISPLLTIVPGAVTKWMLYHFVLRGAWDFEQHVWSELLTHIGEIQRANSEDEIVLTGHSLGGCLAQVAAGQLELPALVFSSPGVSFSARRFGVTAESLERNVVGVVPKNDVVPQVDQQSSDVQPIPCRTPEGSQNSAVQCHSLIKTSCEIWRVCGDRRGRNFSLACSPFITNRDQLGTYLGDGDVW